MRISGWVSPQYHHPQEGRMNRLLTTMIRGGGIGETPLDSHDSNIEVKVYNWCM